MPNNLADAAPPVNVDGAYRLSSLSGSITVEQSADRVRPAGQQCWAGELEHSLPGLITLALIPNFPNGNNKFGDGYPIR